MPYLPPLNLIRKKNEFLAPDFPADSSQFFRVHGFTSAVRQMPTAMRNPFAWTNVSSGKNACFAIWPHVGTKFFNLSHHFLSMDGWPGDAIFFLWGQPLKIIHKNSAKKRSSPLDFIFDTCASASSSHLFLVGEAEHMWLYPFARTNAFSAKNICFVIWARVDTKFLNSSHHVLSVDDWPGDATFFLWGQPLKIIRKYSVKKGPAPWILFLTRAPRPLEVTFFGWWSWTYVVVPLLQGQMYFQKKNACFAIWARWHKILEFVPSCPICGWLAWRCDFFPVGQPLKIIRKYSVKKRSSPLDFIFDTCASASSSHFFGWWSWTCVSVPFCKDNCIFSKKNMCFAIWARVDTKFLNSSHHVLSVDDWPGDATFFLWGQPLKIIRKYSVKKGPAPWILFLTPAPWPLEVTFLVGEGEHMCLYPFAKSCKESYPLN